MHVINGDAKLTDLNAHFIGQYDPASGNYSWVGTMAAAQGVQFQCPKCAQGKECEDDDDLFEDGEPRGKKKVVRGVHYIICWFKNPKKTRVVPDNVSPGPGRWTAWGDDLHNLTLTPSINLPGKGCQWHGFVRDGIATLA